MSELIFQQTLFHAAAGKIIFYLYSLNTKSNTMDFLRKIIQSGGSTSYPTFNSPQYNSKEPLPNQYYQLAVGCMANKQKKLQKFVQLIQAFPTLTTTPAIIKTLTLILKALEENQYDTDFLEELQNLKSPLFESVPELKTQWLRELFICVKSYFLRLSSLSEILKRALLKRTSLEDNFSIMLSDLYLLINLLGLLFPYLTNAFNTIGRYYLKTDSYFFQFYNRISHQLLLIYGYMRNISSRFIKQHTDSPLQDLRCFIKTLPEIELLCDKMQELLLNKYFKGKGPSPKIYFQEEEIAEITFYIKQHSNGANKNISYLESANTAQDQFGEYQE